jgi:hypothetical protein
VSVALMGNHFRTISPHCECVMAIEAIPHRMSFRLYLMCVIESISLGALRTLILDAHNLKFIWHVLIGTGCKASLSVSML